MDFDHVSEPPTKFSKKEGGRGEGLDRTSTLRRGLLEKRRVTFFRGVAIVQKKTTTKKQKNPEIFNDKKSL